MPSTTTTVRRMRVTAPAPRVVYQRTLLLKAQREPPVTATPVPEDELTPLFDSMVLPDEVDVLEELSVVPLVDEDAEVELVEAAVPGIVAALTAAKMPTPATAAIEAPTVMLCSRRSASSRVRARARTSCVGSMFDSMGGAANPYLRSGCEVPESRSEGRGYTLVQFNGTQSP